MTIFNRCLEDIFRSVALSMLYSKHATIVKTCFDDVGNRLLVDVKLGGNL